MAHPIPVLDEFIKGEIAAIRAAFGGSGEVKPGLLTYRIEHPDGNRMRLHLRVKQDGGGILFVDVTDVIHLNPMGVELVRMALEDVPEKSASRILKARYAGLNGEAAAETARVYEVIRHLTQMEDGCYTCALKGLVEQAPLFSLPTNAPYKVDIALTYGCNNQCPHCYNEAGRLPMPSLPLENWYQVLDRVAELGIPHVILTGGEATLHPDFTHVVRYADGLGLVVGLNSNGRYLGNQSFMQEIAEAGLNHVQVTLGSCYPEVHNAVMGVKAFDQTVKGIQTAIRSGVHVITNTTLLRSNMGHVDEIVEFIYDLGIRTFAMNGMIYSGGGFFNPNAIRTEELPPLIARIRDLADRKGMRFLWYTPTEYCRLSPVALGVGSKKCNAAEYSICIEPNGDVLPCQSYYVSGGNILHDPWEEIWQSDLFVSFRDREIAPRQHSIPEKCWYCPDFMVCGSGCRIERDAEQGVRVAEAAGGGCVGCSGYPGSDHVHTHEHQDGLLKVTFFEELEGSFVPNNSLVRTDLRSSGKMDLIQVRGEDGSER
jgi:radical SAM protein with 4Fe4S-binding SPASM domain